MTWKGISLERIVWIVVVAAAVYGTITGTNWFRNYHEALDTAELVPKLESELQAKDSEMLDCLANIEKLKEIPLR